MIWSCFLAKFTSLSLCDCAKLFVVAPDIPTLQQRNCYTWKKNWTTNRESHPGRRWLLVYKREEWPSTHTWPLSRHSPVRWAPALSVGTQPVSPYLLTPELQHDCHESYFHKKIINTVTQMEMENVFCNCLFNTLLSWCGLRISPSVVMWPAVTSRPRRNGHEKQLDFWHWKFAASKTHDKRYKHGILGHI